MACQNCVNGCYKCDPHKAARQANAALKNFRLVNPIPEECSDTSKLQNWFKKSDYIPYAGNVHDSQHTYLKFIDNLALLSPTLGGVINSIGFTCFGGKTDVRRIVNTEFDMTDSEGKSLVPEVPIDQKLAFMDWLQTFNLTGRKWSGLKMSLFKSLKSNGNIFMQVDLISSLGVITPKITFHPTRNVLYKNPNLFAMNRVAVSKNWDTMFIKKNPPKEYPVYPLYEKQADGTISTMIHVKLGETDYYGRPDWLACMHDAFLEVKNKEYLLSAAHNQFAAKAIIEFEGEPGTNTATDNEQAKKDGFESAYDRFAMNYTNKTDDPASIIVAERPAGAKEAFVHEFNINMNENFYDKVDQITTNKVLLVNAWSRKLASIDGTTGLSNNSFIDDLKVRLPIIEYYQDLVDNAALNTAIKFILDMTGKTEFAGLGIESKNPFDSLMKAAQETKLTTPQIPTDGVNHNQ